MRKSLSVTPGKISAKKYLYREDDQAFGMRNGGVTIAELFKRCVNLALRDLIYSQDLVS